MSAGAPEEAGSQRTLRPGALTALLGELARAPAATGWSVPARPGERVGRFEILREIGRGGFGVVYEAKDTELGRSVAFKAIRAGASDAVREQRALAEAEAAARLAHPNIVHLYDVSRCDRGAFLIMELLRGESLDERLARGPLKLRGAVGVAVEISRGLAHAHEQGVVHRDLKPGNVFLCEDGQVKVLDFGLAFVFGRGGVSGGTPAYMAPEQARGEPSDERADVYALGLIVHELVTGKRPFGDGEGGIPAGGKAPDVPGASTALSRLVGRMLARDPASRPPSAIPAYTQLAAIQKSLEPRRLLWAGWTLAAVALAAATGFALRTRPLPPGRLLTALSDTANATGDRDLDGVAELLRTALEQSTRVSLVARSRLLNSLRDATGAVPEVIDEARAREAARRTEARVLIAPAVRQLGGGYELAVQAVDLTRNEPLFTVRENAGGKGSVLDALDRLSDRIRKELRDEERGPALPRVRLAAAGPVNPEAWWHYAEGRRLQSEASTEARLQAAIEAYQRSIAADPDFPLPHARLASLAAQAFSGTTDWAFRSHLEAALKNLHRLPPRDRLLVEAMGETSAADALVQLDRAIAGWPQDPEPYVRAGQLVLNMWGDLTAARPYLEKAIELAPLSEEIVIDFLLALGRLDEALVRARAWTEASPSRLAFINLVAVHRARRETAEALSAARRALALEPGRPTDTIMFAFVEADAIDDLERELERASKPGWEWLELQGRRREALAAFDAERAPRSGAPAEARGMYHAARAVILSRRENPDPDAVWREVEEQLRAGFAGLSCMPWHVAAAGDLDRAERLIAAFATQDRRTGCVRIPQLLRAWKRGDREQALRGLADFHGWGTELAKGEILAELGRDREAVEAFRHRAGPVRYGRTLMLEAAALERLGERDEALRVVERLLRLWKRADGDIPSLREAKALRARLVAGRSR